MFCSIEQDLHRQKYIEARKKNLTKEEYKSIRSLKHNKEMIIKPADKGSAIVIMDKYHTLERDKNNLTIHNVMDRQIQTLLKRSYTYPLQPILRKRFMDDIFFKWPHGREPLSKFINHLNTVHLTIKFTK